MTWQGMIPRRVNKKSAKTWLPRVWYPGESISPGYDIPASQSPQGIIPRQVSFFDTKVQITRRNLNQNRKYLNPLISGPGWFEWWKKTGSRKSSWTVPLNVTKNYCLNYQYMSLYKLVFSVKHSVPSHNYHYKLKLLGRLDRAASNTQFHHL